MGLKHVFLHLLLLFPSLIYAQTFSFTDVSSSTGIASYPANTYHLSDGLSLYDFDQDGWDDL
ncbi:MAG: hypothetical protein RL266_595, partial [Bacteroidota bacterium]